MPIHDHLELMRMQLLQRIERFEDDRIEGIIQLHDNRGLIDPLEVFPRARRIGEDNLRVNQANQRRDIQEQAANWNQQLHRVPETSVQAYAENFINEMIENEGVVFDEPQQPPPVPDVIMRPDEQNNISESEPSQSLHN